MSEAEADVAVVEDVNEEIGLKGAASRVSAPQLLGYSTVAHGLRNLTRSREGAKYFG
jgi:putative aminopeptidase FrvX